MRSPGQRQGSAGGLEKTSLKSSTAKLPTRVRQRITLEIGISSLSSSSFKFLQRISLFVLQKRKTLYLQIEEEEERVLENFGVNNFWLRRIEM